MMLFATLLMLLLIALALAADNELDSIAQAQARAGTKLIADAALSQAAQCLARIGRTGRPLSSTVTRHCADVSGVYEAVLLPLLGQADEKQDLTGTLEMFFQKEAVPRNLTHYGAASIRADGRKTVALLAAQRRGTLQLTQAKDHVDFVATVGVGHHHMRAVVTGPQGVVEPISLSGGRGTLQLKSPGRYQLEVLADAKDGPHVVANRAVFFGIAIPKEPPPEGSVNHDPLEQRMLKLMNKARADARLPPLQMNASVSKVAEAHAKDMRDNKFFAHNSAKTGTLSDRLKAAKIPYIKAAENLSAAPSADDAHESLMASPGHRRNIVDPQLLEAGVGVVANPLAAGDQSYLFVIDFVSTPKSASVKDVQAAVLTAVNQARAQAGRAPLQIDPALSALAERHSRAMAARDELGYAPSQDAFFQEANGIWPSDNYDADLYVTTDPSAVRKSQNVDKPTVKLGVGVVNSESERYGSGVHWVTVVYAR